MNGFDKRLGYGKGFEKPSVNPLSFDVKKAAENWRYFRQKKKTYVLFFLQISTLFFFFFSKKKSVLLYRTDR